MRGLCAPDDARPRHPCHCCRHCCRGGGDAARPPRGAEGSYFEDGDRASGVFGVLATGFSVLLGFVVFLAFTSYDQSRAGAETEALVVGQQTETAQFFPAAVAPELTGELICYGRSVVDGEGSGCARARWATRSTSGGSTLRHLRTAAGDGGRAVRLRQVARPDRHPRGGAPGDRIHGAVGVIPTPLWIVLLSPG